MAKQSRGLIAYHVGVTALTLGSVLNVGLLFLKQGNYAVEMAIANGLLAIFAMDYFVRLIITKNRKIFLIQSAFDLLGIIPLHPVFAFFRLARLVRLIRFHHLFWRLGISGKWTKAYHRFIYQTGFIYLFSISVAIIVLSAFLFSLTEKQNLADSLWWAITTATTVGYGDETPHTAFGKIIASFLMVGGIGFIGLLTSTITDFITDRAAQTATAQEVQQQTDITALLTKIDTLTGKVDQLQDQLDRLEKSTPKK
ncbi:potassium channel family protein [Levilactobacillus mulengensis]|uniref:potassium channel family protein n=1 Tax=Levilactobacillus mulengensis TaxID=2486025 RepID=UPI000F7BA5B9|nr:ion channel [Levilactobacillus mulengensis]